MLDEIQHASIVDDDVAIGPSSPSAVATATAIEPAPTPTPPPPPRPKVAAPRTFDVGASLAGRPPIAPRPRDEDNDRTIYAGAGNAPAPVPTPAKTPDREREEPTFGSKPPGITHPASANEAFPVTRESRQTAVGRPRRGWRDHGHHRAVLLALLLIVQIAWWQREEVMVLIPDSHSVYVDVCDELGCNISPPRDIDGLQIENSSLRQIDGPHKLELKLSLRNRVDVALGYPALELTLLDDKNNVAMRRVLWPQDYARPGTIFAIGIPPQSAVLVRLDTGDAVAANYRVQVFYP